MDKIRIDFFDILGYLIPGSALLMVLWIAGDSNVISIWQIYDSVHKLDNKAILLGLFIAYIVGFILHAVGNVLYDIFWHRKIRKYSPSHVQNDWALIREYGEKHLSILERWYALRALSQNLSAVSLIGCIVCISKWLKYSYNEWFFVSGISLILCYFFLKRSKIFHNYLNDDITATLKLNLEKKKD